MPDYSYAGRMGLYPYDPRFRAIAPPTAGIFDEPQMSVCFNVEWAAHIDGVLSRLLWTDAWAGTDETKQWAVGEVTKLLVSMIARNPCGEGDCMSECCDDIVERLEAIEALLIAKSKPTEKEVREAIDGTLQAYETYIDEIEAVYEDDITNVHPEMAYGDADDPIRDQALCFICRRFTDLICDWVIQNIQLKQANQQTVLNLAAIVSGVSDALGRLLGETAFGQMFQNIDTALELEIAAMTTWITSVSTEQLSIFQDDDARQELACAWYEELKGATPTLETFVSSLNAADVSGNAATIRDKIAGALVLVTTPQQPDPEKVFFIWADLWAEAYTGAQAGIVPDCLCEEVGESCETASQSQDFRINTGEFVVTHPEYDYGDYYAGEGYGTKPPGNTFTISIERAFTEPVNKVRIYTNQPMAETFYVRTLRANGWATVTPISETSGTEGALYWYEKTLSDVTNGIGYHILGGSIANDFRIVRACEWFTEE